MSEFSDETQVPLPRSLASDRFARFAALLLVVVTGVLFQNAQGRADEQNIKLGGQLVLDKCSQCHAVGTDDTARHPEAPNFRDLSRNYPVEHLAEALAEGIITGHPDMPAFEFEAERVDQIIDYLRSIQADRS